MTGLVFTVDYDEFCERLREQMEEIKTHEKSPSRSGWSYDMGCETMFYKACSILCRMRSEQMFPEEKADYEAKDDKEASA